MESVYKKRESSYTVGGNVNWNSHYGDQNEGSLKNLKIELEEAQAGIKIVGRNINNLRYADDTTLMAESEEELKNLLLKVKEESEKVGLKFNIQKIRITASSPFTSWQREEGKVEVVTDFIFLSSKNQCGQ